MTRTFAILEVSRAAFDEIRAGMIAGDRDEAIDDSEQTIDMHGIALHPRATPATKEPAMNTSNPDRAPDPIDPIMQFFGYDHLPPHLQTVSIPFCHLAKSITDPAAPTFLPRNPERTVALRKLLEAKDAAVRALLFK